MYEWARDIERQRDCAEIRAALTIPMEDRLRIGGLKNLISGVTTVVHHDAYYRCFERHFAVRVVRNYAWAHSLGLNNNVSESYRSTSHRTPWMIHAAEGVSENVAREVDELERLGAIGRNTILVHALAATVSQMKTACDKGAGIVACPVSNRFLYGRTLDFASVPQGMRLALGSDSAATSSAGILADLRLLRMLVNWPEEKVWSLVTTSPAEMLGLDIHSGDAVVLREGEAALVIIDGEVRFCQEEFASLLGKGPVRIRVGGRVKFLSPRIQVPWKSLARAAEWTPYLKDWEL
jgi:hypothetical protein